MRNEDDQLWEKELQDGLKKLDDWFPPQSPSLASFERLVEVQRKERRRLLRRDLTIFWLIGMTAVTIGLVGLVETPVIYVAAQLCAMLGFPIGFAIKKRRQADTQ